MKNFVKLYEDFMDADISPVEMVTVAIVYSFEEHGRECRMSNWWLAKRLNSTDRTAQNAINRLVKDGYLNRKQEGTTRILSVNIDKFCSKSDIFLDEDDY